MQLRQKSQCNAMILVMIRFCIASLKSQFHTCSLIKFINVTMTSAFPNPKPRLFYLYNNCDITFLTIFILTHSVNFTVGENRSTRPRKPTIFGRALTADSFQHESVARFEPTNSEVKGACSISNKNLSDVPQTFSVNSCRNLWLKEDVFLDHLSCVAQKDRR